MTSTKLARGLSSFSRSLLSQPLSRSLNNGVRRNSLSGASDTEISSLFSSLSGSRLLPQQETSGGVGGVYFLKDLSNKPAAVFKPHDEEAIPTLESGNITEKISVGSEIKPGLIYGEGYLKEIAAYLLDKNNFHGVPPTTFFAFSNLLKEADKMKVGSLQKYVSHIGTAEDMGWSLFPANEVHKVGILDCRILNTDRHLGNILVVRNSDGSHRLVPIDHGLCLPSSLSGAYFEWLSFPQAKQPFSADTLKFIMELDPDDDIQTLKRYLPNLRQECLDTLKICTIFLKRAASCGMTLYDIGCMMSRYSNIDEPSELEKLKMRVDQRIKRGVNNNGDFWEVLEDEIDRVLYSTVGNGAN